jgi:deferrochelatase/peroxidase EfeB
VKNLPDLLLVRWKQEGSVPPQAPSNPDSRLKSARNFLGFRDGSANPDSNNQKTMDELVWVQPGSDEPAWAATAAIRRCGSSATSSSAGTARRCRNRKASSAGSKPPARRWMARLKAKSRITKDPEGKLTKIDAHIRLANPRTAETQANLILRRPFNYSNGVNKNGQLDMGLLFICYQSDLEKGFITVQTRLNGEPLEEYLKPVGGGYFFTLPGCHGHKDYIGHSAAASLYTTENCLHKTLPQHWRAP